MKLTAAWRLSVRGIPGGYLNALEQRLNDTEIALHEALSELAKLLRDSEFPTRSKSQPLGSPP